jgi:hypothetical protein
MNSSLIALVIAVLLMFGCTSSDPPMAEMETESPTQSRSLDIVVDDTGPTGFTATIGGAVLDSASAYDAEAPGIIQSAVARGEEIRFVLGEHLSAELAESGGAVGQLPHDTLNPIYVPGTNWVVTMGCQVNQVNGCVGGKIAPYCALRLRTDPASGTGQLLFDLHLATWKDPTGHRCFGLYESGPWNLVNYCTCLPTGQDIWSAYGTVKDKVYHSFLSMGLGIAASWVLAEATTPAIIAGVAAF